MGPSAFPLAALFALLPLGMVLYGLWLWCLCLTRERRRVCYLCREPVQWDSWKSHLEGCIKAKEQYIKALPESKVRDKTSHTQSKLCHSGLIESYTFRFNARSARAAR